MDETGVCEGRSRGLVADYDGPRLIDLEALEVVRSTFKLETCWRRRKARLERRG